MKNKQRCYNASQVCYGSKNIDNPILNVAEDRQMFESFDKKRFTSQIKDIHGHRLDDNLYRSHGKHGLIQNSLSQKRMLSSNQVISELDTVYDELQKDSSIGRAEKNVMMIEGFQKILLKNLDDSISGYFFKRKSYYFDKKDKVKTNFLSGFLNKIKTNSSKYDKRFF